MPVTVKKIHERVVLLTIEAPWKVEDLLGSYPVIENLYDAAMLTMYGIVDMGKIGVIPTGALRARASPMVYHVKSGQVLIVGAKGLGKVLADAAFKLTRFQRIVFFDTLEEAQAHVEKALKET